MSEEKKLPVFSYSKISTYKTCPRQWKFIYIDKLPRLDKPATVFGSFCHAVLEAFHKRYVNVKIPVDNNEELEKTMQECFKEARKEWEPKLMDKEHLKKCFHIMNEYLNHIINNNDYTVTHIEKKIWMNIDDKMILTGFIDRLQKNDDGQIEIVDYKTTKDEKYLKDRTQLNLYAYTETQLNPNIDKIKTSYILLVNGMKKLPETVNKDDLVKAKNKVLDTVDEISMDKLYRPKPQFLCNYCDYIDKCPDGKKFVNGGKKKGKLSW